MQIVSEHFFFLSSKLNIVDLAYVLKWHWLKIINCIWNPCLGIVFLSRALLEFLHV